MHNSKAVIGGIVANEAQAVADQQNRAVNAEGKLTMLERRCRTFYDAITTVEFPADAPSWAAYWLEWLLTGTFIPVVEEEEEETPGQSPLPPPSPPTP